MVVKIINPLPNTYSTSTSQGERRRSSITSTRSTQSQFQLGDKIGNTHADYSRLGFSM